MSKVSIRRLLSRLTAIALSASTIGAAGAGPTPAAPELTSPELDAQLAIDREHLDTPDAAMALGRGLAIALHKMRPLAGTHLAASWALSLEPLRRLAVGHSLEWLFPLVGDAVIIDHLASDGDPAIRVAAARAAWTRRRTGGDPGVLARLSDDPDPAVRAVVAAARWA